MNPWAETICVLIVALFGIILGVIFSRQTLPFRFFAYVFPLFTIITLILMRFTDVACHYPAMLCVTTGRMKFVILAFAIAMGLTAPLPRLPHKWEKVVTSIVIFLFATIFCVLPFLTPALIRADLAGLENRLDSNGYCYQSTNYTCGPAAAVTALTKLGLNANEGEIAILSRTTPLTGTLPWNLYIALQKKYAQEGLNCTYLQFDSVDQLKDADFALAAVRNSLLYDHCVTVLDVSDDSITLADPVLGQMSMTHEQFEKIWTYSAILLKRSISSNINF